MNDKIDQSKSSASVCQYLYVHVHWYQLIFMIRGQGDLMILIDLFCQLVSLDDITT